MSGSFTCPECGKVDTAVTDSRPSPSGDIRRRRKCHACGDKFTTVELFIGRDGQINFVPIFLRYEKLSAESRQIVRLTMDVLIKAETGKYSLTGE